LLAGDLDAATRAAQVQALREQLEVLRDFQRRVHEVSTRGAHNVLRGQEALVGRWLRGDAIEAGTGHDDGGRELAGVEGLREKLGALELMLDRYATHAGDLVSFHDVPLMAQEMDPEQRRRYRF